MGKKSRHHTVPRCYLKRFAIKRNNDYYCFAYDKRTKATFESNIENLSVERDFYTLNNVTDPLVWEDYYAIKIEPMMNRVLDKICNLAETSLIVSETTILNDEDKVNISIIIISQMMRGKSARLFAETKRSNIISNVLNEIEEKYKISDDLKNHLYSEDFWKLALAGASTSFEHIINLVPHLLNRYWILYKVEGNNEFITSDNPVLMVNPITGEMLPFNTGLNTRGTICFYPISSTLLIGIYPKELYFGMMISMQNKLVILNSKKNQGFFQYINKCQIKQSSSQAYCRNKYTIDLLLYYNKL